jgi:hypothetical protein
VALAKQSDPQSHMRGETDNVTCAAQNLGLISMHMHSAGSISFGSKVF